MQLRRIMVILGVAGVSLPLLLVPRSSVSSMGRHDPSFLPLTAHRDWLTAALT